MGIVIKLTGYLIFLQKAKFLSTKFYTILKLIRYIYLRDFEKVFIIYYNFILTKFC